MNIIYTEDAIKHRRDRMERCSGRLIFIFDMKNRMRYKSVRHLNWASLLNFPKI